MANAEHLKTLRQSVGAWNAWRREEPLVRPDLSGADLNEVDLFDAKLEGAYLIGANLTQVNLIDARLDGADLTGTTLWETQRTG